MAQLAQMTGVRVGKFACDYQLRALYAVVVVVDEFLDGQVKTLAFDVGIHLKQKLTDHFALRFSDRGTVDEEILP